MNKNMDILYVIIIYTVLMFIVPLISALRINVTSLQCGKTYDIIKEKEIYLDYENFKMNLFETCVINITNGDYDKILCIQSLGPYIDVDCAMHLYYRTVEKKTYFDASLCSSFMNRPRCDRTSEASVMYRNIHHDNVKVNVKLFTKKYVEPTTRKPWSSWSSWSSYDDDSYDVDDDESDSSGTIIGVVVGLIVTIGMMCCCVCAKAKKSTNEEPQYASTVQYRARSGNQSPQQSQNYPNQTAGAQQFPPNPTQQFTSDPPDYAGYHVHHPVFQQIPNQTNHDSSTGQHYKDQSEEPPPNYEEPPPPYPGY